MIVQVAVPKTVWASEHGPPKDPDPDGSAERLTSPLGVIGVPDYVSRTVVVQAVACPIERDEGEQLRPVLVVRWVTLMLAGGDVLEE